MLTHAPSETLILRPDPELRAAQNGVNVNSQAARVRRSQSVAPSTAEATRVC